MREKRVFQEMHYFFLQGIARSYLVFCSLKDPATRET
jgi:hypothetical protein